MPNTLPQAFIQIKLGRARKLTHQSMSPAYILDVLTGLLLSPEPLCTMAVRALAEIGEESVLALIKALASQNLPPSVCDDIVCILADMGTEAKDAAPVLLRLLEDRHEVGNEDLHASWASLIAALSTIAPNDTNVNNYLSRVVETDDLGQDVAIATLNTIASNKAIEILSHVRIRQPLEEEDSLISRLESGSTEDRLAALDEIHKRLPLGAHFFVEPILVLIDNDHAPQIQQEAPRVLAYALLDSSDSLTKWLPLLMQPHSRVSRAMALGSCAQPLFERFVYWFGSSNAASEVCYIGARILRSFGEKGAAYLIQGMSSSSGHRQFVLARELGRMGKDAAAAVPELLRITNHSRSFPWGGNRSAILDALARIAPDDDRVLALLTRIAGHDRDSWKDAAVAALNEVAAESPGANLTLSVDVVEHSGDASNCVGTFNGWLQLAGEFIEVETRLFLSESDPRKLCGEYTVHTSYAEYGELIQQRQMGERLHCLEWSDSSGSGLLELVFNEDFSEFEGLYGDGLSWSGVRKK